MIIREKNINLQNNLFGTEIHFSTEINLNVNDYIMNKKMKNSV